MWKLERCLSRGKVRTLPDFRRLRRLRKCCSRWRSHRAARNSSFVKRRTSSRGHFGKCGEKRGKERVERGREPSQRRLGSADERRRSASTRYSENCIAAFRCRLTDSGRFSRIAQQLAVPSPTASPSARSLPSFRAFLSLLTWRFLPNLSFMERVRPTFVKTRASRCHVSGIALPVFVMGLQMIISAHSDRIRYRVAVALTTWTPSPTDHVRLASPTLKMEAFCAPLLWSSPIVNRQLSLFRSDSFRCPKYVDGIRAPSSSSNQFTFLGDFPSFSGDLS